MILFAILQLVPWYLFPGSTPAKEPETAKETKDSIELTVAPAAVDSVLVPVDTFVLDIPEVMEVSVLLPFSGTGSARANALDFYSGILMAAKAVGESGIRCNVNAVDILDSRTPVTTELLASSDIIIGPVEKADLERIASICPEGKWLISPLEPKVAEICDSLRIVQVPTKAESQQKDLARWIAGETSAGDRIFVVRDKADSTDCQAASCIETLNGLGVRYEVLYNLKDYKNPNSGTNTTTDRFIIASDNESFVCECIRKISVMSMLKYGVAVYGTSKIRSYSNVGIEKLHSCSMRMSSTYFIDYSDPEVKRFVYSYRALFDCEPNQFAFHGYDTMMYFSSICRTYGRQWAKRLEGFRGTGLQANFDFYGCGGKGFINTATVRSVYNPDFTISLAK